MDCAAVAYQAAIILLCPLGLLICREYAVFGCMFSHCILAVLAVSQCLVQLHPGGTLTQQRRLMCLLVCSSLLSCGSMPPMCSCTRPHPLTASAVSNSTNMHTICCICVAGCPCCQCSAAFALLLVWQDAAHDHESSSYECV